MQDLIKKFDSTINASRRQFIRLLIESKLKGYIKDAEIIPLVRLIPEIHNAVTRDAAIRENGLVTQNGGGARRFYGNNYAVEEENRDTLRRGFNETSVLSRMIVERVAEKNMNKGVFPSDLVAYETVELEARKDLARVKVTYEDAKKSIAAADDPEQFLLGRARMAGTAVRQKGGRVSYLASRRRGRQQAKRDIENARIKAEPRRANFYPETETVSPFSGYAHRLVEIPMFTSGSDDGSELDAVLRKMSIEAARKKAKLRMRMMRKVRDQEIFDDRLRHWIVYRDAHRDVTLDGDVEENPGPATTLPPPQFIMDCGCVRVVGDVPDSRRTVYECANHSKARRVGLIRQDAHILLACGDVEQNPGPPKSLAPRGEKKKPKKEEHGRNVHLMENLPEVMRESMVAEGVKIYEEAAAKREAGRAEPVMTGGPEKPEDKGEKERPRCPDFVERLSYVSCGKERTPVNSHRLRNLVTKFNDEPCVITRDEFFEELWATGPTGWSGKTWSYHAWRAYQYVWPAVFMAAVVVLALMSNYSIERMSFDEPLGPPTYKWVAFEDDVVEFEYQAVSEWRIWKKPREKVDCVMEPENTASVPPTYVDDRVWYNLNIGELRDRIVNHTVSVPIAVIDSATGLGAHSARAVKEWWNPSPPICQGVYEPSHYPRIPQCHWFMAQLPLGTFWYWLFETRCFYVNEMMLAVVAEVIITLVHVGTVILAWLFVKYVPELVLVPEVAEDDVIGQKIVASGKIYFHRMGVRPNGSAVVDEDVRNFVAQREKLQADPNYHSIVYHTYMIDLSKRWGSGLVVVEDIAHPVDMVRLTALMRTPTEYSSAGITKALEITKLALQRERTINEDPLTALMQQNAAIRVANHISYYTVSEFAGDLN